MENLNEKTHFLKHEFAQQLAKIDPDMQPRWGKMSSQQMVEHMADYIRIGSGKDPQLLVTPEAHLPKYQEFLVSEKPFRENTPNPLLPDIPPPVKQAALQHAINDAQQEIDYFFRVFEQDRNLKVVNPIFGELDYDMSVQLLHKHAKHHLKQFGID